MEQVDLKISIDDKLIHITALNFEGEDLQIDIVEDENYHSFDKEYLTKQIGI